MKKIGENTLKQRKTRDENSIQENIVMYPLFELKIKYHNISFISGSKLSISSISPFFMIKITSQSVMVFKRWAIVITVQSFNFSSFLICSVEEKQSKQMDQTEAELEKAKTKQKLNLTLSDDTQRDNSENRFWM